MKGERETSDDLQSFFTPFPPHFLPSISIFFPFFAPHFYSGSKWWQLYEEEEEGGKDGIGI